jgi:hypothetical protein
VPRRIGHRLRGAAIDRLAIHVAHRAAVALERVLHLGTVPRPPCLSTGGPIQSGSAITCSMVIGAAASAAAASGASSRDRASSDGIGRMGGLGAMESGGEG